MKRARLFAGFLAAVLLITIAVAPASVDIATGIRHVVPTGTMDECGTKARAALGTYLQNVSEPSPGEFMATGPIGPGVSSDTTSAGTIHCFAYGSGYVVTFTCTAEAPNNPYDANSLCQDLLANFEGKPQTALATPTPPPSGCTTATLVGTWVSNDSKLTLTMTADGQLTDNEDVTGSWVLSGLSVKLTYYGYHNLTLSPDGKHLSGSGYSLTRRC
ncbi:MAG TPA: hypothetical protein VMA98_13665 [Candidatus Acidoferrales bacterium]|nr:hypothetical protein [Candidatus Acidoferrales bacterium]